MKQALINCPSLANSSLLELEEDIRQFWNSGVRWFHIDIMDGHYVPNLCYPVRLVADLKAKYPQAIADVHMMVTDPAAYIEPLRAAGADYVSFHADSTHFVIRSLRAIREVGMKAGIVLNPSQQVDVIRPYLDWVDLVVLIMPSKMIYSVMDDLDRRMEEKGDVKFIVCAAADYAETKAPEGIDRQERLMKTPRNTASAWWAPTASASLTTAAG